MRVVVDCVLDFISLDDFVDAVDADGGAGEKVEVVLHVSVDDARLPHP